MKRTPPHIVLIQAPWAATTRPSIALGILSGLCLEQKVPCRTLYPNLDLADLLGFELYDRFSYERILYGLSEHLFAVDLFGKDVLNGERSLDLYWEGINASNLADSVKRPLDKLREKEYLQYLRDAVVPSFLDETAARILQARPTAVGFSASNNQVMSSLALARRIKALQSDIQTIFGGANFHGSMGPEYHRSLPGVIDNIFVGEAEEPFREYLSRLTAGKSVRGIPGVTFWSGGEVELIPGRALQDLSLSPRPDYDEFFLEAERVRQKSGKVFNIDYLPFESSRGCWWGEKSHCVFCGNNEEQIHYRAKDVSRTIEDIISLSVRYKAEKLAATDWILSQWYGDELCRRLKELDYDLDIFYEVRPTLKKRQIKLMKEAGINKVQPGIESLSTPILKLMNKGATVIRHVQFLRWCLEYGVKTDYNILAGFPGEKVEWYREMTQLFPKIYHLHPPLFDLQFVELHRFSPLYERSRDFGVHSIKVRADYALTIPPDILDPDKIGYFFQFAADGLAERSAYVSLVQEAMRPWITGHENEKKPVFEYKICPGYLRVLDSRTERKRSLCLSELYQDVVLLCDEAQNRMALGRDLSRIYPQEVRDGTLDKVIEELIGAEILMKEGHSLLTLPVGHRPRTTEELRSYVLGANISGANVLDSNISEPNVSEGKYFLTSSCLTV